MKAEIEKCECYWHPMYTINTPGICGGKIHEIPDDLYKRYNRNKKDFEKIQDELEKIHKSNI